VKTTDVLVIGSGIAGLAAALRLAQNPERKVILLTRASDLHDSNTSQAQGGIIHRPTDDTPDALMRDILNGCVAAGPHPCRRGPPCWRSCSSEGPAFGSTARRNACLRTRSGALVPAHLHVRDGRRRH
jgi:choline dehydrogenase-like flavoprotein